MSCRPGSRPDGTCSSVKNSHFMGEQRFMRDRQILEMSVMEWSVLSLPCYFTWSAESTGDVCVLFLAYDCVRL